MGMEPDTSYEDRTRADAEERGWKFEKIPGSMNLINRMVNGDWGEDDFLVVQPGQEIVGTYNEGVVTSGPPGSND